MANTIKHVILLSQKKYLNINSLNRRVELRMRTRVSERDHRVSFYGWTPETRPDPDQQLIKALMT